MPNRFKDNSGQSLTEYLVLLMLIAITCIAATSSLGSLIKEKLQTARRQINTEVKYER